MDTININGTEYVALTDIPETRESVNPDNWEHICVIATNGWIFEGYRDREADSRNVGLADAHVVRRWDNGLGIGGLADPDHKDEYTLDAIGSMEVYTDKVIAVIELRW